MLSWCLGGVFDGELERLLGELGAVVDCSLFAASGRGSKSFGTAGGTAGCNLGAAGRNLGAAGGGGCC